MQRLGARTRRACEPGPAGQPALRRHAAGAARWLAWRRHAAGRRAGSSPCRVLLQDAILAGPQSCAAPAILAPAAASCLEVGCGTGYVLTSLALLLRQVGAAAQLLGTDVNAAAAAATRATLAAHEVRAVLGTGGVRGPGLLQCSQASPPVRRTERVQDQECSPCPP